MTPGDHIIYTPPDDRPCRPGVLQAISGQSALIQFDDCCWPQWAPLARLGASAAKVKIDNAQEKEVQK